MPEMTAFEVRLAAALDERVRAIDDTVDAASVAARVASEPRPRVSLPTLRGSVFGYGRVRHWIAVGVALIMLALAIALVGGPLLQQPKPVELTAPTIVEVVGQAPSDGQGLVAGTDGKVWRLGVGRLTRLDPASGDERTWNVADDVRFYASAIAASRAGGVWLGRDQVIWRFDGSSFHDPLPTLPADVSVIAEASDGTVWAGVQGAVMRLDGPRWVRHDLDRPQAYPMNLVIDTAGRPWAVTALDPGPVGFQIARLDSAGWTAYRTSREVPDMGTFVSSMAALDDGGVLIGTNMGVVRFDGTWRSLGAPTDSGEGSDSWTVAGAADGAIWAAAASSNGIAVAHLESGGWHVYGPADGLPEPSDWNDVRIVAAAAGVIASINEQPYRLVDGRWQALGRAPAPALDFARQIVAVARDEAWLVDGSSLWHVSNGVARPEQGAATGSELYDVDLLADRPIIAASDGVRILTASGWERIDDRKAIDLTVAPDGRVWVVGDGGGATRILAPDGASWRSTDLPEPPRDGQLLVDRRGTAWMIGSGSGWGWSGMLRFDGRSWEPVTLVPAPPDEPGFDLTYGDIDLAPNGDIWVTVTGSGNNSGCCTATPDRQVARYDGVTWTFYGEADGLPSEDWAYLKHLAITPDGRVWLSGTSLAGFDGERWTTSLEGLVPGALAATPDGSLWAAGPMGVARIALPSN
jgi:hypothetical protein